MANIEKACSEDLDVIARRHTSGILVLANIEKACSEDLDVIARRHGILVLVLI